MKETTADETSEHTRQHTDLEDKVRITFSTDGTCYTEQYDEYDDEWERDDLKYETNGDELIIFEGDGDNRDELKFTFSYSGNNLVLSQKEINDDVTYESSITLKRR